METLFSKNAKKNSLKYTAWKLLKLDQLHCKLKMGTFLLCSGYGSHRCFYTFWDDTHVSQISYIYIKQAAVSFDFAGKTHKTIFKYEICKGVKRRDGPVK